MSTDVIIEDILLEPWDDWVSLVDIRHLVGVDEGFDQGVERLLTRASEIASIMVRNHQLIPGSLNDEGEFVPWDLPAEASAARIEREIQQLIESGNTLFPGDIAWFTVKPETPPT